MIRDFRTLQPGDSLVVVTGHILAGFPHDFPVQGGWTARRSADADGCYSLPWPRQGENGLVGDVMRRDIQYRPPSQPKKLAESVVPPTAGAIAAARCRYSMRGISLDSLTLDLLGRVPVAACQHAHHPAAQSQLTSQQTQACHKEQLPQTATIPAARASGRGKNALPARGNRVVCVQPAPAPGILLQPAFACLGS